MNFVYYEKKPKFFSHDNWVAPEHWTVARNMKRIKGVLQMQENSVLAFSRNNPPAWVLANRSNNVSSITR